MCFLESEKPLSPRCHCREHRPLCGLVTDSESDLGNVFVFFLNWSWLCVLEGNVAVALQIPRSRPSPLEPCRASLPVPKPPCLGLACLVPTAGRNQSRLAWRRTLQEQLPANGNYFKTNWCGFSVKPTWSINKVGLYAASLLQTRPCLACGLEQSKHGLESELSLCVSDLKSKSSALNPHPQWLVARKTSLLFGLSSGRSCHCFLEGFYFFYFF